MSDPGDPYRNVDIGGGMNPFGETIGGAMESGELVSQLTKTEEVLISIANQLSGMTKSFEGFQPVAKKMADSKFVKSTSNMEKMFKGIAGASPKAFLIQKLFNTLSPLLDLFKPFQVILDLISALLKVMVGEALGPMFEALQPLYDMFISMMPMFAELGAAIGELMAAILKPLVEIFMALMPVIFPIIGLIIDLIKMAIEPLKAIFDALMPIILPIIDIIIELITSAMEPLKEIFKALMPLLMPLIQIAFIPLKIILQLITPLLEALIPVFDLIGMAVKFIAPVLIVLANGFIWFINVIIDAINLVMNVLTLGLWADIKKIGMLSLDTGGGGQGRTYSPGASLNEQQGRLGGGIGMATGGIAVSQGVYELAEGGQPEAVVPLNKWEKSISTQNALLGAIHGELVSLSFYNSELVKEAVWKKVFG